MKWENLVTFAEAEEDYIALYNHYELILNSLENSIQNFGIMETKKKVFTSFVDFKERFYDLEEYLGTVKNI